MGRIWAMVVLLWGVGAAHAAGGLDLYFVRHAETVANATGVNDSGTVNVFSEQGEAQVRVLTGRLKTLHFDAIIVSSAPRALNTILPYLMETGQKGEIWPEIAECCWQRDRDKVAAGRLLSGAPIRLSAGQAPYFTFRDASAKRDYRNSSYADGVAQVRRAEALLKERYFGCGKTILMVAHYHSGQVLLAELLGKRRDELPNLKNAQLAHLRQGEDGRFTLLSINDSDIAPERPAMSEGADLPGVSCLPSKLP